VICALSREGGGDGGRQSGEGAHRKGARGVAGQETLHEHLCATLVEALRVVPVSHLSSLRLLDRALKHNFPEARTKHVADTRALCLRKKSTRRSPTHNSLRKNQRKCSRAQ
jgi:hypothetical protein